MTLENGVVIRMTIGVNLIYFLPPHLAKFVFLVLLSLSFFPNSPYLKIIDGEPHPDVG
jgi:hypothetical protein